VAHILHVFVGVNVCVVGGGGGIVAYKAAKQKFSFCKDSCVKKRRNEKYIFGLGGVRVAGIARGLERLLQIELRGCHVIPDSLADVKSC
jgi:hypothetical protein